MDVAVNYRTNDLIYQMILAKLSNNKWHNFIKYLKYQRYMIQDGTITGFFLICMKH